MNRDQNFQTPTFQEPTSQEQTFREQTSDEQTMQEGSPLLVAERISKTFEAGASGKHQRVHAVTDVSLKLYRGETLALVGESGCGKSTLGRLLIGLLKPDQGSVFYQGQEITSMKARDFKHLRSRMQIIFQDPYASLDPRMSVEQILAEPLLAGHVCSSRMQRQKKVESLLQMVEIPKEYLNRYPHQFSGGQRQRIGIARALALNPEIVVCDEPVSALDVSIQSQVLNLLKDLQEERNLTYLFISHDLSVVRHISNRICVMFLGKICEIGRTEEVFAHPGHPYTRLLLDSIPLPDPAKRSEETASFTGEMPSPLHLPSGCFFRTRCPYASAACAERTPELTVENGRSISCFHPL